MGWKGGGSRWGGPPTQTWVRIKSPNGYCIAGAGQVLGGGGCKLFSRGTTDSLCPEPNGQTGTCAGNKQAATTWA